MKKKSFKLNRIIKFLIYSDLVFYTGWGLISPIFAIFIINNILGGTAFVVGLAAAANLIARSLLRVPFGILADKSRKKAYYFMLIGLFISALIPIGYIFSTYPYQIYICQIILGITLAMSTAGWTGIFEKSLDKGKESTEWGLDAVAVGLGPGIAALIGGAIVTFFSFNIIFLIVTIFGLAGVFLLLVVKNNILQSSYQKSGLIHNSRESRRLKKHVVR